MCATLVSVRRLGAFLALIGLIAIGSPCAPSIAASLEARYRHARTLNAFFFERYTDGRGAVLAESGTVYFSRPGRMRWEYESPEKKLFLVDGTNVWFYVPADHTASRAKVNDSTDWRTPLALLAGKADLSMLCRKLDVISTSNVAGVSRADTPSSPGNVVLRCLPRGGSDDAKDPTEVLMEADAEARLVRVVIREPGDAETEFRFGDWKEDLPIPEAMFHFQPPPGVAIVDQQALTSAIR